MDSEILGKVKQFMNSETLGKKTIYACRHDTISFIEQHIHVHQ